VNPYESPEAMARALLAGVGDPPSPRRVANVLAYLRNAAEVSVRARQTEMAIFWNRTRAEVERESERRRVAAGG
jgi:hypothetical protein